MYCARAVIRDYTPPLKWFDIMMLPRKVELIKINKFDLC